MFTAPSRTEIVVYALCAVVIVIVGWRTLASDASGEREPAAAGATAGSSATVRRSRSRLVVHVVGAVRRPGVVTVTDGARVRDALRRTGGPSGRADLGRLNLAARVADGQQIVVPSLIVPVVGAGAAAAPAAATAGDPAASDAPLSLGGATAEQLETLDGVGPATAKKIIEFRDARGGLSSVDDLAGVAGIGPKRLEALRRRLQP